MHDHKSIGENAVDQSAQLRQVGGEAVRRGVERQVRMPMLKENVYFLRVECEFKITLALSEW